MRTTIGGRGLTHHNWTQLQLDRKGTKQWSVTQTLKVSTTNGTAVTIALWLLTE